MKKIITLTMMAFLITGPLLSQDTLLYENFNIDPTPGHSLINNGNDTVWVNVDLDLVQDANNLPMNWFWDSLGFSTFDTTGILMSSSWLDPAGTSVNYLITPPITLVDASGILSWKSAPFQTPLYLDGYHVLVSTTDNIETSFTDTLFSAAEYVSGSGFDFSAYTFSPGFVHGMDSTYIEDTGDSARFIGILRPFTVSLSQYSGQTIYIAFVHGSNDDNLISLDDIMVTANTAIGLEQADFATGLSLYPNPANDRLEVRFEMPLSTRLDIRIYDMQGKLIKQVADQEFISGIRNLTINTNDLPSGAYNLVFFEGTKYMHSPFMIQK